ncbi:MAG: lipoprotein insertase outer membrane protein LolB [Methylotenera sp.]
MLFRHNLFVIILLVVSGCATLPPPPSQPPTTSSINQKHLATLANIKTFSLKGRLGVVANPRGFSGSLDWQHQTDDDNIDVYSPVGGKVANIVKKPSGVTLTTQDGRSVSAMDAETLTEATLGWRLPLEGLSDWALGKPTTSKIDAATWDAEGRLTTLKQDGWDISFDNYAENSGYFLPSKTVLKSEKVNLKLLVENWVSLRN